MLVLVLVIVLVLVLVLDLGLLAARKSRTRTSTSTIIRSRGGRSQRLGSDGLIQNLPHLMGERGGRERFLQKRHAFVEHAVMDDGVLSVGGGEKNPGVRIRRTHPFRQFFAAHVRHDDIGE